MRLVPKALTLAAFALAGLVLVGCNNDDIETLLQEVPPPPPTCQGIPPYTTTGGTAPTVNGDGSISFTTPGTIVFNTPLASTTRARMCLTGRYDGSSIAGTLMGDTVGGGAFYFYVTRSGPTSLDFLLSDDGSGVACPIRTLSHPSFVVGGKFLYVFRVDQTGPFPVTALWATHPPNLGPPDLASNDLAYCSTTANDNWVTLTTNRASLSGDSYTVFGTGSHSF